MPALTACLPCCGTGLARARPRRIPWPGRWACARSLSRGPPSRTTCRRGCRSARRSSGWNSGELVPGSGRLDRYDGGWAWSSIERLEPRLRDLLDAAGSRRPRRASGPAARRPPPSASGRTPRWISQRSSVQARPRRRRGPRRAISDPRGRSRRGARSRSRPASCTAARSSQAWAVLPARTRSGHGTGPAASSSGSG